MKKLLEKVKELFEKFKSQSKKVKIAVLVAVIAVVVAIISAMFYTSSNKYAILFSDLEASDAKSVVEELTKQNVETKLDSTTNTVWVPKNQVDKLKLEMAPTLTSGSTGYELMDSQSSFGMTDDEFNLKKKRMLEGEIEKTIKSMELIENARVSITASNDSIFVKDSTPGTASVTLQVKNGATLNEDQVKSIVAVVSASAENIPKENVSVVDQNMNWLTKDISFDDAATGNSENVSKQQQAAIDYETKLQKAIVDILEPIVGKGKIKAQVNAKLDFDSKQKTVTTVDPNKVIVSQETLKEFNSDGVNDTTGDSPVDNNMSNEIVDSNGNSTSTKEEQKTNYDSGKTEAKIIEAPGKIERLTASVIIDKTLNDSENEVLQNVVSNAIGLNETNGDKVTVAGIPFDTSGDDEAKALVEQMNAEAAAKKRNLLMIIGGVVVAALIGLIAILLIKRRKKNVEEEEQLLDTMIDDTIIPKEPDTFDPIEFESKNEKTHLENEIKKYATEKPEQVVEIIKSWLNENEG